MPLPDSSQRSSAAASQDAYDPDAVNPFDDVEFLPGLGTAVLWVVLSYALVSLLLLPAFGF